MTTNTLPIRAESPLDIPYTYPDDDASSTTTTARWTDATSTPGSFEPSIWGHALSRVTRDAVPWPGRTYMILSANNGAVSSSSGSGFRPDGRALALLQGAVRLVGPDTPREHTGCWHWVCEEKGGWFGLRNAASWTYLGRDMAGQMQALAAHHKEWEYLCARRHPDGTYVLLNANFPPREMERICIADDGCSLVLKYGQEALWEFVELHL